VLYNGWFLRKLFHYLRKNDQLTIEVIKHQSSYWSSHALHFLRCGELPNFRSATHCIFPFYQTNNCVDFASYCLEICFLFLCMLWCHVRTCLSNPRSMHLLELNVQQPCTYCTDHLDAVWHVSVNASESTYWEEEGCSSCIVLVCINLACIFPLTCYCRG
jgi:hypothetical protein